MTYIVGKLKCFNCVSNLTYQVSLLTDLLHKYNFQK